MPNFAEKVEEAVDALSSTPRKEVDEGEFIGASQLVIDGVREIRKAVLANRVSSTPIVYLKINYLIPRIMSCHILADYLIQKLKLLAVLFQISNCC